MSEIITVVVPVYGVEKYIHKCVDSIINQTYRDIEIILVDDGSPDNCPQICDEYASKDSRIRVIHKKNGGLSDARNAALDVFTGDYVTFVDSDDWISEDYVEYLYYLISKYDADVSECDFRYVDDNDNLINSPRTDGNDQCFESKEAIRELLRGNGFVTSATSKLFKRDMISKLRFPIGRSFEDIPVTYEIFLRSEKVAFGNKALYTYYFRRGSISCSTFSAKRMHASEHLNDAVAKVVGRYDDLKEDSNVAVFRMNYAIMLELDGSEEANKNSKEVHQNIKRTRGTVIKSRNVSWKWKVKALLTYFGDGINQKLFNKL